MRARTSDFAASLAAFFADLGTMRSKVTVVTISEFGRRVVENSSGGLDHGWGNVMFALGAGVRGGFYARWPGLTFGSDADLSVTTDYRDVLAEIVAARTSASVAAVFPGLARTPIGFMEGQTGWGRASTPVVEQVVEPVVVPPAETAVVPQVPVTAPAPATPTSKPTTKPKAKAKPKPKKRKKPAKRKPKPRKPAAKKAKRKPVARKRVRR
jgi:hypothetical protein